VNNAFEGMWKGAVVVSAKVLHRHSAGRTEENHEKLQPERSVSKLSFEPDSFEIRRRTAETFGVVFFFYVN
jgi:hypothetical protein